MTWSRAVRGSGKVGRKILFDHRHHDLRLGIAESDVELDHLRAHRASASGRRRKPRYAWSFGAHPGHDRIDDLVRMRRSSAVIRAGSARTRPCRRCSGPGVVVEDALVILRRAERGALAVAEHEERDLWLRGTPRSRPAAGVAEAALASSRGPPRRPGRGIGATTTPLPAASPSAFTTTGNPSSAGRETRARPRRRRRPIARRSARRAGP